MDTTKCLSALLERQLRVGSVALDSTEGELREVVWLVDDVNVGGPLRRLHGLARDAVLTPAQEPIAVATARRQQLQALQEATE